MSDQRKIMVLGAGDLARRVFHELAQAGGDRHVRLVGRAEDTVLRTVNLARFAALQRGRSPQVSYAITDVTDTARTAECIAAYQPDVLFLSLSYQPWWVISTLPKTAYERLYAANFGPWLPMHLAPTMLAMRAVRAAGSDAAVVNAAYPDAVHPVLAAIGLSPHIGIGNVANNVPGIRVACADHLGVAPEEVEVRLVAHHYVSHRLSRQGDSGPAEMALAVGVGGEDVTAKVDVPAVLRRLPERYRRTGGMAGQTMTAASALSVLEPLLDRRDALVHAPGPLGRPGGYPATVGPDGIRLDLPDGMTEEQALAINLSGQVQDGITEIRPDGTVRFEPAATEILARELGYDCPELPLSQVEARADELGRRFGRYRERVTA